MVEPDRRDDGHDAVGDVRRVPAAAEADLDDRHVDGRVGERGEGERRHHLEVRQGHASVGGGVGVDDRDVGGDLLPGGQEAVRRDRLAVEADALAGVDEVRGREQAGPQAERAQQGLHHAGRGALAVRAGDVDDGVGRLGAAEQVGEGGDPGERGLDLVLGPPGLEGRPQVGQRGLRRFVPHSGESRPVARAGSACGRRRRPIPSSRGPPGTRGRHAPVVPIDAHAGVGADRSWQSYRLLADNAIDVVLEANLQTVIQWISPSVEDVLGWAPGELVGRSAVDLVHPDDIGEIMVMAQAISEQSARVHAARCRMLTQAGPYKAMQLRGRPALGIDGVVVGHIITMQDTSERDDALRALSVLSEGNRVLARVDDEAGLLAQMCETIVTTGQYPLSWYGRRIEDDLHTVERLAAAGPARGYADAITVTWDESPLGRGATGTCIRTGTTQVRARLHGRPGLRALARGGRGRRPPELAVPSRRGERRGRRCPHGLRHRGARLRPAGPGAVRDPRVGPGPGPGPAPQHPRPQGEDPRDRGAARPDRRERGALPAARRELLRRRLAGGGGRQPGVGVRLGSPRARLGAGAADRPGPGAPASRRPRDRRRLASAARPADDRRGRVPHRLRRRVVALDGVQRPPGRGPGRAGRCRGPARHRRRGPGTQRPGPCDRPRPAHGHGGPGDHDPAPQRDAGPAERPPARRRPVRRGGPPVVHQRRLHARRRRPRPDHPRGSDRRDRRQPGPRRSQRRGGVPRPRARPRQR